jgi:thiamine-phosphate pyrophosphorylase
MNKKFVRSTINRAANLKHKLRVAILDEENASLPNKNVTHILLRGYHLKNRRIWAEKLAKQAKRKGLFVLMAGDYNLARKIKADGLHLPEYLLSQPRFWHKKTANNWQISAACHSIRAIRLAEKMQVNFAFLSPVFKTSSHPEAKPLGTLRFARLCAQAKIPIIALGGAENQEKSLKISRFSGVAFRHKTGLR